MNRGAFCSQELRQIKKVATDNLFAWWRPKAEITKAMHGRGKEITDRENDRRTSRMVSGPGSNAALSSRKIWAPGPKDPIQSPWRLKKYGTEPIRDAADHITTAIDKTIAEYAIDEERVTIMGYSMGGEGTMLYAPVAC